MSNLIIYKGYTAKIEYSAEDEAFFGTIQGIDDLITFEITHVDEIQDAMREAIEDYLDMCSRIGKEPDKEYKGQFNVRISPVLHKRAAQKALEEGVKLNDLVQKAIKQYIDGPMPLFQLSPNIQLVNQKKELNENLWSRFPVRQICSHEWVYNN